jgi:hypothetical protein
MRIAAMYLVIAAAIAGGSGAARAESRAWAAAKAGLPADAKVVIGLDVGALQKTQVFATYYPKLREKPDAAKVLDAMKTGCNLDPVAIIQSMVLATAGDGGEGAMYIAVTGVDRAKLSSCLQVTAQVEDKDAKVAVKVNGDITEVTRGAETAYFGWVGKDVVVVPFRANERESLVKWMSGKGALGKSDVGKALAKVNTGATIWGAAVEPKEIQPGITAKGAYGTVNWAKGAVVVDVHAVMESAAKASEMATMANQQLAEIKKGGLPPELGAVLKAIAVAPEKAEVRIKANVLEKDLIGALAFAASAMGGP